MISCKTDRDFSINNLQIIVEVDSLGSYYLYTAQSDSRIRE